ncbi:FadR/GntR family transcriptional regulator [candidate division CSSED10-310 bacterium]|uniref:FadR/GntR family transcriptional regulator n=1 Tax=candidate division CSSED10-310 bacterium TaxID=2855610 RepID=A0ABV6YRQ4_UNCC1
MRLSEKIALKLEKAILTGDYPIGSRFPPERELVERYQVSRSTIREAVGMLAQLGLVETLPQSGTYVSNFQTEASLDLLLHIMKHNDTVDTDVLLSLLEFRKLCEMYAVRKALANASNKDIKALRSIVEREYHSLNSPSEFADLDYSLHYTIICLAQNLVIQLVFNSFKPVYRYYTDIFFNLPEAIRVTVEQHKRLCQAFTDGDVEGAEQVMAEALDYGKDSVLKELGIINPGISNQKSKDIKRKKF